MLVKMIIHFTNGDRCICDNILGKVTMQTSPQSITPTTHDRKSNDYPLEFQLISGIFIDD